MLEFPLEHAVSQGVRAALSFLNGLGKLNLRRTRKRFRLAAVGKRTQLRLICHCGNNLRVRLTYANSYEFHAHRSMRRLRY